MPYVLLLIFAVAAVGRLLVLVAFLVVPYLVHNARQERNS